MSPSRSLATVFLVKSNFSPQFFTTIFHNFPMFQCSTVQVWLANYIYRTGVQLSEMARKHCSRHNLAVQHSTESLKILIGFYDFGDFSINMIVPPLPNAGKVKQVPAASSSSFYTKWPPSASPLSTTSGATSLHTLKRDATTSNQQKNAPPPP